MIISLARSPRCARCLRDCRHEPKAFFQINLPHGRLAWLTLRFRLCPACADEMLDRAERNPKLRLVD